jgi:hypothetical protein
MVRIEMQELRTGWKDKHERGSACAALYPTVDGRLALVAPIHGPFRRDDQSTGRRDVDALAGQRNPVRGMGA